ncbi:MAG: MarR family transcriptional regulator [Defluviitaleaceae bacterium]|nr:MarR family transcriptional regulator [Defluviitaleaceae bacterium]
MEESNIDSQKIPLSSLKETWHKINCLYDLYAKSLDLSFVSVLVLWTLHNSVAVCTQKELCQKLGLPKQVVNSIIKSFWERGYVELKEAKDRRNKEIIVTKKGNEFAKKVLSPLSEAEYAVWKGLSPQEIAILAGALEKYIMALEEALQNRNDTEEASNDRKI